MEHENHEIETVLREAVHLTAEEILDYLDGWLAPDLARSLEEHIANCHHCSEELAAVKRSLEKEPPTRLGVAVSAAANNVIELFSSRKRQLSALWLGDKRYGLAQLEEFPDFWEVTALTTEQLVLARCTDSEEPGILPVAIEVSGAPPVLGVLANFEPTDAYKRLEERITHVHDQDSEEGSDTIAASRSAFSPAVAFGYVAAAPRRRRRGVLNAEIMLSYRAKNDKVEVFRALGPEKLLVRVSSLQ